MLPRVLSVGSGPYRGASIRSFISPVAMWDARWGITIDTGVSLWTDPIGGYDMAQANTSYQPAYGKDAYGLYVEPDGTDDFVSNAALSAIASGASPIGVVGVFTDIASPGGVQFSFGHSGSNVQTQMFGQSYTAGNWFQAKVTDDGGSTEAYPQLTLETSGVFVNTFDGTDRHTYLNAQHGSAVAAAGMGTTTVDTAAIGCQFRASKIRFNNVRIRTIAVTDQYIEPEQAEALIRFLRSERGL